MAGNFSEISPWFSSATGSGFTSTGFRVGEFDKFAVLVVTAGTAAGTMKLQASIDDSVYVDIPDTKISISGSDNFLYSMAQFAYKYVRMVYVNSSGTSTITATVNTVKNK